MAHSDSFFSDLVRSRSPYRSLNKLGEGMGMPTLVQQLRNARNARRMPSRGTIDALCRALPQIPAREIETALFQDANPATVTFEDGQDRRAKAHVARVMDTMPQDKRDVLVRIIDEIAEISR